MRWSKWHTWGSGAVLGFLFLPLMGFSTYGFIGWLFGAWFSFVVIAYLPP